MVARARARKTPTNVSVRKDLIERARELDLNLSQLLEGALEEAIRAAERARWLDENKEAFEYANEFVAKHGLFGEEWRKF